MYKIIVSCYYWPTGEGGLRLRAAIVKSEFEETGTGLEYPRLGRLTSLDKLASTIERRRVRRLKAKCEIELVADLSLLDNDVQNSDSSLIFLGRTHDVSAAGLGMVLPSTIIDERFCSGANRLNLTPPGTCSERFSRFPPLQKRSSMIVEGRTIPRPAALRSCVRPRKIRDESEF